MATASTPVRPSASVAGALWAAAAPVTLGGLISALPGPLPAVVHSGSFGVRIAAQALGAGLIAVRIHRHRQTHAPRDSPFVKDLTTDPTDRAIMRLAHSLGLTVTAEGVEDEAALEVLRRGAHRPAAGDRC